MKKIVVVMSLIATLVLLFDCSHTRRGGELRLKHRVTIATAEGPRTFSSVVSMKGVQTYNYGAGTAGWGGIGSLLTGEAIRVPSGERDFYFLLTDRGGNTPARTQIELIKKHFAFPNWTADDRWVGQWKSLSRSDAAVSLTPKDYPTIAVMPHGGWMDDARIITLKEAEQLGLRVSRYDLMITRDQVGTNPSFEVRYRPTEAKYPTYKVSRESFTVENGPS